MPDRPPTKKEKIASNLQEVDLDPLTKDTSTIETSDAHLIDANYSVFDELEDAFDVAPMVRTSIDESNLPTTHQEYFLHEE